MQPPTGQSLHNLSQSHTNQLSILLQSLTSDLTHLNQCDTNIQINATKGLSTLNNLQQLHSTTTDQEKTLQTRIVTLETELAGSILTRDEAVATQYSLESRLTQALKDCQGLSTSSATMRSQSRKDFEKIQHLETKVRDLEVQLKNSVPAEKVQSVLEAAAQRVSGICDGAQKSQHNLDRAKREIKRLQSIVDNIPSLIEEKTVEEVRQRRRSDGLAKEATKRADKLERKLIQLEQSTNQLRGMLKSAQEGIGVMKTIARIRNHDKDGKGGKSGSGRSIGFDAVANTIDGVGRQVDARMNMKINTNKKKKNGSGSGFGRRKKKDVFANMVNG